MDDIYRELQAKIAEIKNETVGVDDISFAVTGLDGMFEDPLLPPDGKVAVIMATDEQKEFIKEGMLDLLGMLRGLYHVHQHAHWTVSGEPYYGDHLMFQRLYEGIGDEIDTVAEKTAAYLGFDVLNASDIVTRTQTWVDKWGETPDVYQRSIAAEQDFQDYAKKFYSQLEDMGVLTLGFDDFIMAAANSHETYQYLLQQRAQSRTAGKKQASTNRTQIRVSALGDLSAFLRVSENVLVHKSDQDFWRLTKDADGNNVIEKLHEDDVIY